MGAIVSRVAAWLDANADKFRGPAGQDGKDGQNGADRAELRGEIESALSAVVFQAELLDERGEVKDRTTFGASKPLKLRLVPVK